MATMEGVCGKVVLMDINGKQYAVKQSHIIDYTLDLEYAVGKLINTLKSVHFPKIAAIDDYGNSLYMSVINGKSIQPTDNGQNIAARTVAIAAIFNEEFGISHNDLHYANVLLVDTDITVQAYIYPDGEELAAYTYGKSPVIIDFGLAFPGKATDAMLGMLDHSRIGIFPHEQDLLLDALRYITSIHSLGHKFPESVLKIIKSVKGYDFRKSWFKTMFPDFLNEVSGHSIPVLRKYKDIIDLCFGNICHPLAKVEPDVGYDAMIDAFEILHTVPLMCVKHLLDDLSVPFWEERYGVEKIRMCRESLDVAIIGINNRLYEPALIASATKASIYSECPWKSVRDAARMLIMAEPTIEYKAGMLVSIYNVKKRETKYVEIGEVGAKKLNTGEATLSTVFNEAK